LIYHGPERIRKSALDALCGIRSPAIMPQLKEIALDETWSYGDRTNAINALAALPLDIYLPELSSFFSRYLDGRYLAFKWPTSPDEFEEDRLYAERRMVDAIFHLVGKQTSNTSWFYELLEQAEPRYQCELLCGAIERVCQLPLEPILTDRLTSFLNQYPDLL